MSQPIDKKAHFLGGWAIATTFPEAWGLWALLPVVGAAAAKEAVDRTGRGTYDPRDFWATVLGGVVGHSVRFVVGALAC